MPTIARFTQPYMFLDSLDHCPEGDAELFLVEGESAGQAIAAIRDPRHQAVMALQGKPLNALKANPRRLSHSPAFAALTSVLGEAPGTALPLGDLRYRRLMLLMDPDADGIHCSALLQIFFHHCMRPLLESGHIEIVHAPWGELRRPGAPPLLSFSAAEFQQHCRIIDPPRAVTISRTRSFMTRGQM